MGKNARTPQICHQHLNVTPADLIFDKSYKELLEEPQVSDPRFGRFNNGSTIFLSLDCFYLKPATLTF